MTIASVQSLEHLENIKKRLIQRAERLKRELQEVEDDLKALERILFLARQPEAKEAPIWPESYLREFEGLTQVQALVKIARTNGRNRLNVQDAKQLLLATGLIGKPKNAASIVYSAIIRSERFRKVGKGEYELLSSKETATHMIDAVVSGESSEKVVTRFTKTA
jgi:hypothetical protein